MKPALQTAGVEDLFEEIILSDDEDVACEKPNKRIYQRACERMNIEPGKSLFIDDKEKNAISARSFGMIGLHFLSAKLLKKELQLLELI